MFKAISQDFSSVMVISKNDVEKIIQEEKKDFERYKEISDKIILSNDYSDLKTQCHYCLSKYHSTYQCSRVFYDKDPFYLIQKQSFSFPQERKYSTRSKNKTRNALTQAEIMAQGVLNIREEYTFEEYNDQFFEESQSEDDSSSPRDIENMSISTRNQAKSKTIIHSNTEKNIKDSVQEEKRPQEFTKAETKFEPSFNNFNESNLHVVQQQTEDDSIYCETATPIRQRIASENLPSSTLEIPERFDRTDRIAASPMNFPSSMKRGSIESTMYALPKASSAIIQQKQDLILKQLLEQISNLVNNPNGIGRSRKSTLLGSQMDPTKIIGASKENISSSNRKSYVNTSTGTFSRKSVLRPTLRQHSFAQNNYPKRVLTFVDGIQQAKTIQFQGQGFNNDLSTMKVFGDLDRMQLFEYYYPHQNAPETIKRVNLAAAKSYKKMRSKRKQNHGIGRKSLTIYSNKVKELKTPRLHFQNSKVA